MTQYNIPPTGDHLPENKIFQHVVSHAQKAKHLLCNSELGVNYIMYQWESLTFDYQKHHRYSGPQLL